MDRNKLLPAQPEVDAEYTEALRSVGVNVAKWSHLSLPAGHDMTTTARHMAQLEAVPASLTLTFVSHVQLGRSSDVKDINAALLWCAAYALSLSLTDWTVPPQPAVNLGYRCWACHCTDSLGTIPSAHLHV